MAGKGGDFSTKAVTAVAGAAAAFVARKAIFFVWTKVMGRKPPGKAEDPDVAIGEALAWTVVIGTGVAIARLLAVRTTARYAGKSLEQSDE
jgi:low affinity Fe/Cu permease